MNRRQFLHFPLALALTGTAAAAEPVRGSRGIKVPAGKDRYAEELLLMGGRFDLKVSSRDTGGDLCIYDTFRESKGGPALHLHHSQDEWFYVLAGRFKVRVGEDLTELGPGDSAFAPRRIPHAFALVSEGEGRMLVLFQPAGSMEDFFRKMAGFGPDIPPNEEAVMRRLCHDHGMEVVGPPLPV